LLISGPCSLATPAGVERVDVISAEDMYLASQEHSDACDLFIAAAAVADYRPQQLATQKIKKGDAATLNLALVKNPDIVASIAALRPEAFIVGFAAESENLVEYAERKLTRKKLDLIIANDISQAGIGFNSDDNAVTIIDKLGPQVLSQRSKQQLARELIALIAVKMSL
jgi:phosphopantothenoylcysteine decarboxylase / phosphopantothenate---cysteine ligase